MDYSEFVERIGCPNNFDSYKVYRIMNSLFIRDDMTEDEMIMHGKSLLRSKVIDDSFLKNCIVKDINMLMFRKSDIEKDIAFYNNQIEQWKGIDSGVVHTCELKMDLEQSTLRRVIKEYDAYKMIVENN